MVVNVNMCASMFDETFHVMKFSAIAKKVREFVSKETVVLRRRGVETNAWFYQLNGVDNKGNMATIKS